VDNTSGVPVTIHYLSTLITGSQTATVYYLPGGLLSCTVAPVIATFTLVGSAPVTGLGGIGMPFTTVPIDLNVVIPPGQKYAFCISSPSITYTGTGIGTSCPVFASNSVLSVHEGFGGTIAGPISGRRLNGKITYSTGIGGCPSPRDSILILVNPIPVVHLGNDTIISSSQTLTLNPGAGFTSYLWSNGATTPTITVNTTGTYSVTVTNANGCHNSDTIHVQVLTGIDQVLLSNAINFYPNPANEIVTVQVNFGIVTGTIMICLYDELGRKIIFNELNSKSKMNSTTIDISSLSKGIYYFEFRSEHAVMTRRLVKL
jgi:hypothetical protein